MRGGGRGQGRNGKLSFESSFYIFRGVQNTCLPQLPSTQNLLSPELHSDWRTRLAFLSPLASSNWEGPRGRGRSGEVCYVERLLEASGRGRATDPHTNLCLDNEYTRGTAIQPQLSHLGVPHSQQHANGTE